MLEEYFFFILICDLKSFLPYIFAVTLCHNIFIFIYFRLQSVVQHTLKISLSYCKANWIRTCRLISDLPPLLAGIAALELPHIRRLFKTCCKVTLTMFVFSRKCFEQMSVAYSSRNLGFPADCLKELLLYSRICDLTADCHICGIDYNGETSLIYFRKGTYKSASEVSKTIYY